MAPFLLHPAASPPLTSAGGSVITKWLFPVSQPRNRMMKTARGGKSSSWLQIRNHGNVKALRVGGGGGEKPSCWELFPKHLKSWSLWILPSEEGGGGGALCLCVGDYFIWNEPSLCKKWTNQTEDGGWGKQLMPLPLPPPWAGRASIRRFWALLFCKPLLCDLACTFFPFLKYETTCKWGVRLCAGGYVCF